MQNGNNDLKILVAREALKYVSDGMIIGVGSGTTMHAFLSELAKKIKEEKIEIFGIPTSFDAELKMFELGIPIIHPVNVTKIDLAIDGADSVLTSKKILIKGGGGAFVREKIVDYKAKELLIIVDESKINREFPIPLEALQFSITFTIDTLSEMFGVESVKIRNCKGKLGPCISDNGNIIIDLHLPIDEISHNLEVELNRIPGIVDNGIFSRDCTVLVSRKSGVVEKFDFTSPR
ncbi:MAG: ribose 5-phosphate isomerase A [Candidatus Njordarchaeia archaeon]